MKKRQRKKNRDIKRATRIIFKKLNKMSSAKIEKLLKKYTPICQPDTCDGECQGMGHCELAENFRNDIPRIIMEHENKGTEDGRNKL